MPELAKIIIASALKDFYLSDGLSEAGSNGNQAAWTRGSRSLKPICHIINSRMEMAVEIDQFPLPAENQIRVKIHMTLGGNLYFPVCERLLNQNNLNFTFDILKIFPDCYKIRLEIEFLKNHSLISRSEASFLVCFVVGKPSVLLGQLSYGRLVHAYRFVRLAKSAQPHNILAQVHSRLPGYRAEANVTNPWVIASHFNGENYGNLVADCQSMARYMEWIFRLLGFGANVESSVVVIFTCPVKPHVVLESLLTGAEPHCQNPPFNFGDLYKESREIEPTRKIFSILSKYVPDDAPYTKSAVKNYIASDFHTADLLDDKNNGNFYEACFKLTVNGVTNYYPGGVKYEPDEARPETRLQVIKVFKKMGWQGSRIIREHYNYETERLTVYELNTGREIGVSRHCPLIDGGTVGSVHEVKDRMKRLGEFSLR